MATFVVHTYPPGGRITRSRLANSQHAFRLVFQRKSSLRVSLDSHGLLWSEEQRSALGAKDFLACPGATHDATGRVFQVSEQYVSYFVRHDIT